MYVDIASVCLPAVWQIQLNLHGHLVWPLSFNFKVNERNSTNLTYQVLLKASVNVHQVTQYCVHEFNEKMFLRSFQLDWRGKTQVSVVS